MAGVISITSERPMPAEGAAFAITICFQKHEPRPQRVFQAADGIIRAFQHLDKILCASIDSNIEPVMVLEEIEAGSIKIWLRDILNSADDQALKEMDWKPAVGKYLVRAKYIYIRWSNKESGSLLDLARDLRQIAAETDVRHMPDYAPPPLQDLASVTEEIEVAKKHLLSGDRIIYSDDEQNEAEFNLSINWSPKDLASMLIKDKTKFENMPMVLIVKKPDYLGKSKWDLRHGSRSLSARIEDEDWLSRFQRREIDVRPGDALRCLVTIQHSYGFDNELIDEDHTITTVEGVVENHTWQTDLEHTPPW